MAVREAAPSAATATDRRNARLYLFGLATSMLGDSAMSLVAGIWVKSLTGSTAAAGLAGACMYLPSLFGRPPGCWPTGCRAGACCWSSTSRRR